MTEARLCRNRLHSMIEENISRTTDGAERCRACRREQARRRKEREAAEGAALMDMHAIAQSPADLELPFGTLGRKWVLDGKCTADNLNLRWFFNPLLEEDLATYCEGCPVVNLCFAFSVIGGEYGVWGGTTEKQREMLNVSQRLTIRQSYGKMYSDYLGEKAPPSERTPIEPSPVPFIDACREATIMRGIEAAEYESVAGVAGFDKNRFGRRPEVNEDGGFQS